MGGRAAAVAAALLGVVAFALLGATAALIGANASGGIVDQATGANAGVSALAASEIPARYLALYRQAARRYGLDWAVLAAIGRVECDHGRDPDPSCHVEGAVNAAGAGGPMQFLASTWARYGVDGDGDGRIDRWDPADAIFAAARYLRASGAPHDYRSAIYAYNHSSSYVAEVESWAARYRSPARALAGAAAGEGGESEASSADLMLQSESATPVRFVAGERAELLAGDGHLALVPTAVPATVQAMVVAGNELQGLQYGPQGHPDPRGAPAEDCSSTINYILYRAGVRPIAEILRDNPLAQDYVRWGSPGPGRWVTIYATTTPTAHAFIVIAGLRLDTSHNGTDVGPNRAEDGPRWRILSHLPTWARWAVRHPPGL